MSDVAQLGFAVDSSQAKSATVDLDKLSASAKSAQDAEAGLASTSKAAGAGLSALGAGAREASTASTATTAAVRLEKQALAAHTAQLGLNRIQMLEVLHIGRELPAMFAMGVDPIRALTMESGRLATLFQMGNGGMGGTFRALLPILGPVALILAALGVGVAALTDKLNAGHTKALTWGETIVGVVKTAWHAFTSQFGPAPKWFSDLWGDIETIVGNAVNGMIHMIADWAAGLNRILHEVPDYFVIAFQGAANLLVQPLNWMMDQLKKVLGLVAMLPGGGSLVPIIAGARPITAPDMGASGASVDIDREEALYRSQLKKNATTDYLGQVYKNGLPTDDKKAKADPYGRLIQSAKDATAALNAQAEALGKTAQQAAYLEEKQKLLNDAAQKGLTLSPTQLQAIDDQAKAYSYAKANLEALTDIYNTGKSVFEDFTSTMKTGFQNGESAIQSFGDAASKVLDDLANKALQMAADGVWNMIFGSLTGGATGGLGGGSGGGIISSLLGLFGGAGHNANGTDNWRGGLTWVGEQGPELVNLPAGAGVTPARQSAALASQGASGDLTMHVNIDARNAQQGVGAEIAKAFDRYRVTQFAADVKYVNSHGRVQPRSMAG